MSVIHKINPDRERNRDWGWSLCGIIVARNHQGVDIVSVSDPRRPILTQPMLDRLRLLAAVPTHEVVIDPRELRALLNDREDWVETAYQVHLELNKRPAP